jgi:hypothetical protein
MAAPGCEAGGEREWEEGGIRVWGSEGYVQV